MYIYILKIYFQSQEVTYAELSLPRNKGYAPMRSCNNGATVTTPVPDSSGPAGAPVIYARIDHSTKRNYHSQPGPTMLHQAHTTVPLLITNNTSGGVSPSSIMNTSCESSTSSGSASRYSDRNLVMNFFF